MSTLLVGLTREEIDAIIHQLRTSVPEVQRQALIISAISKLIRAAEMKPIDGIKKQT